jgi:hypothetical protein
MLAKNLDLPHCIQKINPHAERGAREECLEAWHLMSCRTTWVELSGMRFVLICLRVWRRVIFHPLTVRLYVAAVAWSMRR